MSNFKIRGNATPTVGVEQVYSVEDIDLNVLKQDFSFKKEGAASQEIHWSIFEFKNEKWIHKPKNDKTGYTVNYKFFEATLDYAGIKLIAKRGKDEAFINIKTQKSIDRKIVDVNFLDENWNKPTKPFAYGDKLIARIHCVNLDKCRGSVTLWQDDISQSGNSGKHKATTLPIYVEDGKAEVKFLLTPDSDTIKKMVKEEKTFNKYHVTVEIFNQKTFKSQNVDVIRDKNKSSETKKQTPAEEKGPSKKEEKGINKSDKPYDYHETTIDVLTEIRSIGDSVRETLNKVLKVDMPDGAENKTETCVCKDYDLVWGGHPDVNCEFKKKVIEISKRQNFDPNHLMAVMWVETNKTFSTSLIKLMPNGKFRPDGTAKKENRGLNETEIKALSENFVGAVGLIQFTPVAIDELNNYYGYSLTKRKLSLMTQLIQLDYVEKYIEFWVKANKIKSKLTLADLYLLIFSPSKMDGSKDSTTLYKEGTTYYNANKSIDTDKKNGITKKELAHRAYESLEEGSKKENKCSTFTCEIINEQKIDDNSSSGVLEEMKIIADSHRLYLQETDKNRTADTEAGLAKMDCSEFVSRYLHKLGVTKNIIYMTTANMTTEASFRKVIENNNIDLVKGSKMDSFIPEKGDIFAWGQSKNGGWSGHTGVVYEYDEKNDRVTIMEAIGKSGAVGERKQVKNGGYSGTNCTRTAIYDRLGGALYGHDGWFGYFRPKNYTKKL